MVLLRSQGELLLLVSGLRTKRQDKDRRYIRNSIAWVGEKTDEPILRKIATLVLKNNLQILENVVSESSNSSGELFEVNWQAIKQLIPPNVGVTRTLPEQQKNGKIARTSESRTQELANELMQYDLLARDGALVAVTTGFKPKAIFARANVWRGLSNDPEASNEWIALTRLGSVNSPPPNRKILLLVIVGALIILAVSTYLIAQSVLRPVESNTLATSIPTVPPIVLNPKQLCLNQKLPQLMLTKWLDNKSNLSKTNVANVERLQNILNELPQELKQKNSEIPVNGKLNVTTKEAVQYFQDNYNKKAPPKQKIKDPKGNVDTATWKALWEKTKDNPTLQKKRTWETICKDAKPK
jgi:hypothetical protein